MSQLRILTPFGPKIAMLKFPLSIIESSIGGKLLKIPLSFSIVVVTRKKINSKKAMSAIEPALTSGADLFAIILYLLIIFFAPDKIIAPAAIANNK